MGKKQTHPLRAFTLQEEQALRWIMHATSERLDVVKRARALLSVQAGHSFTAVEIASASLSSALTNVDSWRC